MSVDDSLPGAGDLFCKSDDSFLAADDLLRGVDGSFRGTDDPLLYENGVFSLKKLEIRSRKVNHEN